MGIHKRQNAGNLYRRAVAAENHWLAKSDSKLVSVWKEHVCGPQPEITNEEMFEFKQAFALLDVVSLFPTPTLNLIRPCFRTLMAPSLRTSWALPCVCWDRTRRRRNFSKSPTKWTTTVTERSISQSSVSS